MISQELDRIIQAKEDIRTSILQKGVTVPSNTLIDDYDTYIGQIQTGISPSDVINLIERDITSFDIPSGTVHIGNNAFASCSSLASVTIPNSVTSIGVNAFNATGITSIGGVGSGADIELGANITSIGNGAFAGCVNLTTATIPDNITTIGNTLFYNCTSLTSVTVEATTPPTLGTSAFDNTNNCPIYVPGASVAIYQAASGWSTYSSRIQAIPTT